VEQKGKEQPTVKTALEDLVSEMIDRGIYFEDAVNEFEKRFILKIMERNRGNISKTADVLHIHRNTLSKKLESYNGHDPGNTKKAAKKVVKRKSTVRSRIPKGKAH
jgi:DNA-binding NtrC family response regulator